MNETSVFSREYKGIEKNYFPNLNAINLLGINKPGSKKIESHTIRANMKNTMYQSHQLPQILAKVQKASKKQKNEMINNPPDLHIRNPSLRYMQLASNASGNQDQQQQVNTEELKPKFSERRLISADVKDEATEKCFSNQILKERISSKHSESQNQARLIDSAKSLFIDRRKSLVDHTTG